MALILRSLFGLTGNDEPMPGATDREVAIALEQAENLRLAMEKAPALTLEATEKYENTPDYKPEPAPTSAYGPRPR